MTKKEINSAAARLQYLYNGWDLCYTDKKEQNKIVADTLESIVNIALKNADTTCTCISAEPPTEECTICGGRR